MSQRYGASSTFTMNQRELARDVVFRCFRLRRAMPIGLAGTLVQLIGFCEFDSVFQYDHLCFLIQLTFHISGYTARFGKLIRREIFRQVKVWETQIYFVYPQGHCRIRKAPSSPTAAQYLKFFKPKNCRKRSAEARHELHGQCDNERREFIVRDNKAVDQARQDADAERRKDRQSQRVRMQVCRDGNTSPTGQPRSLRRGRSDR